MDTNKRELQRFLSASVRVIRGFPLKMTLSKRHSDLTPPLNMTPPLNIRRIGRRKLSGSEVLLRPRLIIRGA